MERMLEYQKLDGELFKLEKQLNESKFRAEMNEAKEIANQAKEKMIQMEIDAKKYHDAYNDLQKSIEVNLKNVEILNKQDINEMDLEKLKIFTEKSDLVGKNLSLLQKKLYNLQITIQQHLVAFNKTTKSVQTAKAQFAKAKEQYDNECEKIKPQLDKIKEQLLVLQKGVAEDLFDRYQKARKDKIYPVFVPLVDKRCGACRMELPSALLDSIKTGKMLECEQCRRIIFYKNED